MKTRYGPMTIKGQYERYIQVTGVPAHPTLEALVNRTFFAASGAMLRIVADIGFDTDPVRSAARMDALVNELKGYAEELQAKDTERIAI